MAPRRGGHIAAAALGCFAAGLGEFLLMPAHPEMTVFLGLGAAFGVWAFMGPAFFMFTTSTSWALQAYRSIRKDGAEAMGPAIALLLTFAVSIIGTIVGRGVGWAQNRLKNETLVPIFAVV